LIATINRLGGFARRDFLTAVSYRAAFLGDIIGLGFQIVMFYFLSLMIDPSALPTYDGQPVSYLEWASVGIILGAFMTLGLEQTSTALRQEQLTGTLESLLMSPVRTWIIQLGLATYDLVYVPIRTAVFLGLLAWLLDVSFLWSGLPALFLILLVFIPFVWGLGMVGSAIILTFKRGARLVGIAGSAINILSGAYFPLELFPPWAQAIGESNPVGLAFEAGREALLAGATIADVGPDALTIAIWAVITLTFGQVAGMWALARERRRGTLTIY
jgi:ABC-2 type transport system permease protein